MAHRVSPMYRNFLAGEIDPRYDGLIEGDVQAMRTAENVLVRKLGGVTRRPGTIYAGAAHATGETTRLIPFTNAAGTSYVLEFADYNMNVWKQSTHASVATGVVTPWAQAHVFGLKFLVIGNDIRVTHPSYDPYKITWVSDSSWSLNVLDAFKDQKWFISQDDSKITSSSDGVVWTETVLPALGVTDDLWPIAWGAGNVVVAEEAGVNRYVMYSTDGGKVWKKSGVVFDSQPTNLYDAEWGNGMYIFVGIYDSKGYAYYSTTAAGTYVGFDISLATQARSIAYSPTLGMWAIAGGVGTSNKSVVTADNTLTPWTGRTMAAGVTYYGIRWANGTFVACGDSATISSSTNGTTWSTRTSGVGAGETLYGCVYGGGNWLCFGTNGALTISSDNGVTWTLMTSVGSASIVDGAYYNGVFVLINGSSQIYVSQDYGYTWDLAYTMTDVPHRVARGGVAQFEGSTDRPRAIAFHEQRLFFAGTADEPDTLWGSKIGYPEDFSTGYLATDGLAFQLAAPRNMNIYWMESVEGGIVIGAQNGIGFLQGGEAEGLTPLSRKFRWVYPHGSADVQGIRVGNSVFYATRGGEIIRAFPSDKDHTALAEHIAVGGVTQFDYSDDPFPVLYAVRADGILLCGTVHGDSISWTRWVTRAGDEIESIAVVPNATTNEDELWMCVKRVIGGATKRFIEYAKPLYLAEKQDAHFVDSGVFYASTTASHITGLTHLASQSVACLIGGTVVETHTVTAGGSITLTRVGSQVHAGLAYTSKLQTCRLGMGYGPITNHIFANVHLWLYQTIGGKVGPTTLSTESRVYNSLTAWTTDMEKVAVPGTWDDDSYLWVIQSDPLPMTVMAMSGAVLAGEI